jgi:hypothetical protein
MRIRHALPGRSVFGPGSNPKIIGALGYPTPSRRRPNVATKSIIPRFVVGLAVAVIALLSFDHPANSQGSRSRIALPLVYGSSSCPGIPGVSYGQLPIVGPPANPPPANNPDINLDIRGWQGTNAFRGLVTYNNNGSPDPLAPQLWGLFTDNRVPTFSSDYQVFDWNWGTNQRGGPLTTWPVTLAGFQVQPGEIIQAPPSGRDIGQGYRALVLYAAPRQITLKYTGEDNVVYGYTIHIEGICVEPGLLARFQSLAGSRQLPALNSFEPIGRAAGPELDVAIRDAGTFMDPRSHGDWWQGK